MQAEFACHIGMRGKYFCRSCWVKGSDAMDQDNTAPNQSARTQHHDGEGSDSEREGSVASDAGSVRAEGHSPRDGSPVPLQTGNGDRVGRVGEGQSAQDSSTPTTAAHDAGSTGVAETANRVEAGHASAPTTAPKRKGRFQEGFDTMVKRVSAFLKVSVRSPELIAADQVNIPSQVGKLRNKEETQYTLRSYFTNAKLVGKKTAVKAQKTQNGIKDTIQDFFLDRLFTSYKGRYGPSAQRALDEAAAALPDDITSPVWRIKGSYLDLNQVTLALNHHRS